MSRSLAIHEPLTHYSRVVLPRVGGGVGVGGRGGMLVPHSASLTEAPVDNSPATASPVPTTGVECKSFGRGWVQ